MTNQAINHEELIYDPDHDEIIDQQALPNTENNQENETLEAQEAEQLLHKIPSNQHQKTKKQHCQKQYLINAFNKRYTKLTNSAKNTES